MKKAIFIHPQSSRPNSVRLCRLLPICAQQLRSAISAVRDSLSSTAPPLTPLQSSICYFTFLNLTMGKSRVDSAAKSDRKFEKKLEFYAKVRDTVAGLNAQKSIKKKKLRSRQKKLKAYDLSTLTEFLPDIKAPSQQPTQFKLNCKSRKKLLMKESKQLNAVLNHPAFQSDPLEAIHQHLQNTQPPEDENPKKKLKNKNGSKKGKKKKKSSASNEPQSMDL